MLASLIALALSQAAPGPSISPQAGDQALDRVRLVVGTELTGRIRVETADYVEIELGPGTVIGLATAKIAEIVRAAEASAAPAAGEPADATWSRTATFEARNDWYVVHDAEGRVVGRMHATLAPADDGGWRIGEEWTFTDQDRTVETTRLDAIDADGLPRSTFHHERVRATTGELSADRVVRAVVDGDTLRVHIRSNDGAETKTYRVQEGLRFPLELRHELRRRCAGEQGEQTHPVFDPTHREFERVQVQFGAVRRVAGKGGEALPVRELRASTTRGHNAEWLDGGPAPVRREVAGPALVAVRVASESEAHALKGAVFPPAFRSESGGAFGLWLPNPGWRFVGEAGQNEVVAELPHERASLALLRLPQLDAGLGLDSAADAVMRWMQWAYPELIENGRTAGTVRASTPVMEVRATGTTAAGETTQLWVHVLQVDGAWFASCAAAPRHAFDRLEDEFRWMVERFELRRAGFDPGSDSVKAWAGSGRKGPRSAER
jgi:hypothetical protein